MQDFDNMLDIDDNKNNSTIVALNATIYTCESRWSCYSTTIDMDLSCNTSCTHTFEIPSYLSMDVTKDLFGIKLSHKNTTLLHHECNGEINHRILTVTILAQSINNHECCFTRV